MRPYRCAQFCGRSFHSHLIPKFHRGGAWYELSNSLSRKPEYIGRRCLVRRRNVDCAGCILIVLPSDAERLRVLTESVAEKLPSFTPSLREFLSVLSKPLQHAQQVY